MQFSVIPIAEEHIAGFCAAVDIVARERIYLANLEGSPIELSRAYVLGNLRDNRPHYVALHNSTVIGWCDITSLNRDVFAHTGVLGIGILPAYRGKGIGKALMTAAIAKAKDIGLTRIELTVREENFNAIALYKKVGFEIEGTKRNATLLDGHYSNDLIMALLLDHQSMPTWNQ